MSDRRVRIVIDAVNKAKAVLTGTGTDLKKLAATNKSALNQMRVDAQKARAEYLALQHQIRSTSGTVSQDLRNQASAAKSAWQASGVALAQAQAAYAQSVQQVATAPRNAGVTAMQGVLTAVKSATVAVTGFFTRMVGNAISSVTQVIGIIRGMLIRMAALATFAAAAMGLGWIVSSATTIERQRAQLVALTKDAATAGKVIAWVRKQAVATPFEIPGLVEMVAQLRSVGLPIKEWFTNLGDLAVQGGRDLQEGLQMATLALVRLKTGATGEAMEQLRRLKISMEDFRQKGVQFTKGGELISSRDEAISALGQIIKDKFGGSMKAMENTAAVVFSNIVDSARDVAFTIAGIGQGGEVLAGGFFQKLRDAAKGLLDDLEKNKVGVADWGARVGAVLGRVIDWFTNNRANIARWWSMAVQAFKNVWQGVSRFAYGLLQVHAIAGGATGVLNSLFQLILDATQWWKDHADALAKAVKWMLMLFIFAKLIPVFFAAARAITLLVKAVRTLGIAQAVVVALAGGWGYVLAVLAAAAAAYGVIEYAAGKAGDALDKAQASIENGLAASQTPYKVPGIIGPDVDFEEYITAAGKYSKTALDNWKELLEDAMTYQDVLANIAAGNEAGNASLATQVDYYKKLLDMQKQVYQDMPQLAIEAGLTEKDLPQYYKALTDQMTLLVNTQNKLNELNLSPFKEAVSGAKELVQFSKDFGSDADYSAAVLSQITALQALIPELEKAKSSTGIGSNAWNQYRDSIADAKTQVETLFQALKSQPLAAVDAKIGAAKAQLEMLKSSGGSSGTVKAGVYQVIALEKERLKLLEAQVAQAEKMGQWIKADELKAKIFGVRSEILEMQKTLRGNLEDEFNKMAQQMINAPQNMQRVLARSGVSLWQRQMDAMKNWSTTSLNQPQIAPITLPQSATAASMQPNTTVNVFLDGQKLEAKVETYVDSRLKQYGSMR